jgi:hypothetical protein
MSGFQYGGAVRISEIVLRGLLCDSTFSDCAVSGITPYGGAMLFDSRRSELTRSCGDHCTLLATGSNGNGAFAQVGPQHDPNLNQSVSEC